MNNPIEIFYCWQAFVTALMVYMFTQMIKVALPFAVNPKSEKKKLFIKRVVMPAIPPLLGFVGGALIPLHPEVLITYVSANVHNWFESALIYGAWGAAVGQFADYIYSKVSKLIGDFRPNVGGNSGEA